MSRTPPEGHLVPRLLRASHEQDAACFCRWPPAHLKMGQRAPDNHVLRPGCRLNTVSSLGVCHVSGTDGSLTPCHGVFGHRCAYGHVLRPTTLMPAGWTTGRPPFVPLGHLAINIIHPPSSNIGAPRTLTGLNKRPPLALLAHMGMPSDTVVHTATSSARVVAYKDDRTPPLAPLAHATVSASGQLTG